MQRQAVFDPQSQCARSRVRSRTQRRVQLAIAVLVGFIQLALKNLAIEKRIGLEAWQSTPDVRSAEMSIPNDFNVRQGSFSDLQAKRGVGQALRRNTDGDGNVAPLPVVSLQVAGRFANFLERYRRTGGGI